MKISSKKIWKKCFVLLISAAVALTATDLSALASENTSMIENVQEETQEEAKKENTESELYTGEHTEQESSVETTEEVGTEDESQQKNEQTQETEMVESSIAAEENTKVAEEENATESSVKTVEVTASGNCGADGDNLTWELTSDGVLTISGKGAMADYSVTSIPWGDFGQLVFNGEITHIGNYAFFCCSGLTGSLTIPSSVSSIGDYAFYNCSGLTGSLTIPSSVSSIGDSAFAFCHGLTGSLTISEGVSSIGNCAFHDCSGLTGSLTIPLSVTEIGDSAFYSCSGLTGSLTIPSSVNNIGDSAFDGCSGLIGSLTISSSVSEIGNYVFSRCSGLTGNLTIPSSVSHIGNQAFWGCSGLTGNLTIPSSVSSIGNYAFYGCSGLTGSLTIPSSVIEIGNYAFANCSGLKTLYISSSSNKLSLMDSQLEDCIGLKQLYLPQNVTCGDNKDINTTSLETIYGVKGSSAETFANKYNISFVEYDFSKPWEGGGETGDSATSGMCGKNLRWSLHNGYLRISGTGEMYDYSDSSDNRAPWYDNRNSIRTIAVDDKVTSIGNYAFAGCSIITNVNLPASVKRIGKESYKDCTRLSSIFYDGVECIDELAFSGCTKLVSLTLGKSLTEIADNAFTVEQNGKRVNLSLDYLKVYSYTYAQEWADRNGFQYDLLLGDKQGFMVTVYNEDGEPLPGVEVSVSNCTENTRADGKAQVYGYVDIDQYIYLNKKGYKSQKTKRTFHKGENHEFRMVTDPNSVSVDFPKIKTDEVKLEDEQDDVKWLDCNWSIDFGGSELINQYFPVRVETNNEENVLEIAIGMPYANSTGERKSSYQKAKNLCTELGEYTQQKGQTALNKLLQHNGIKKMTGEVGIGLDISLIGYVKIDRSTNKLIEGGGILAFSGEGSLKFRAVTPAVVTNAFYAKLSVSFDASGKIRFLSDDGGGIAVSASLELSPGFGVGIGIGEDSIVYAEGGFEGEAAFGVDIPFQNARDSFSAKLKGDLYLEAGILGITVGNTYSLPDLNIWPQKQRKILTQSGEMQESVLARDYLQNSNNMIYALNTSEESRTTVYPYADVQLGRLSDGSLLAVWVSDNGTKSDENRTTLVYSVYKDGSWSSAREVHETGRGDFNPCLVTEGNRAYLAWANIRKVMGADTALADLLKNMDISYCVYENGSFSAPVSVTSENPELAKTNIKVAASGDREAIVWTQNNENDVLGDSGSTAIYARERMNGKWQPSICIHSGLSAVEGVAPYYVNGVLCVAYSVREDASDSGCDVYLYQDGIIKRVTDNGKVNRNLTVCEGTLYWLAGDEIMQMDGADIDSIKTTGVECFGAFQVVSGSKGIAIVLNEMDGIGSELYLTKETDGKFGRVVPVTSLGRRISYFAAAYKDDDSVAAVFVEKDLPASGTDGFGKSYIHICDALRSDNISVEYIYADGGLAAPGVTLPISVGIANESSHDLDKVQVKISSNGQELYNGEIDCAILAGEQGSADLSVTLGTEEGSIALKAEVLPIGFTDSDLSDNEVTKSVGLGDIELSSLAVSPSGMLTGKIRNIGYADSEAVTLRVVAGGQEGEQIYEKAYGGLATGTETDIRYTIPTQYLNFSENKIYEYFYIECSTTNAERFYYNNSGIVRALPIAVTELKGIPESLELREKESYLLTPQILPLNAHNKKVYYLSDNTEIAYVTDEGRIIAGKPGEACITAVTSDGSFEAKCKITVNENVSGIKYHLSHERANLIQGESFVLSVLDNDGKVVDSGLKWESSDTKILKVENGTVTALKPGVASIVVGIGTYYDVCIIEADADGISGLLFEDTLVVLEENETKQLSVHIQPESITDASGITWSSSNEQAVAVSDSGIVTALRSGTAVITAETENGVSASCKIQVNGNIRHTVIFDSDFGMEPVKVEDIPENSTVTPPEPPVRQGYSFLGWFTQRNGQGIMFDGSTAVTQNVMVYAYWKLIEAEEIKPVVEEGFVAEISEPKPVETEEEKNNGENGEYEGVLPEDIPTDGKIPNGLWIAKVPDVIYTGKAIKPEVHIYDSTTRLIEKKDYTISYKNNVNAYSIPKGTAMDAKAPTVTVTGKGNYAGKETAVFNILPVTLDSGSTDVFDITLAVGNKVQKPIPVIMVNGKKLVNKKDFTLEYPDQSVDAYKGIGIYRIKVIGKGNYQGQLIVLMTITDKKLMSKASISKIKAQTYTGNPLTPKPVVKYGGDILVEGTGYELEYRNNTEIGTATILIKGIGDYCGQTRVTFPITGGSISSAKISDSFKKQLEYTGAPVTQSCTLTAMLGQQMVTLNEGKDYTVRYFNNTKAGKATVVYTGKGAFTGTLKKTYTIMPYDIGTDSQKKMKYDSSVIASYVKGGSQPVPILAFNNIELKAGADFMLAYKNNKAVSSSEPVIIVKGKGNYKGSITIPFQIMAQDLSNLTLTAEDGIYQKGKTGIYKTALKLTDINGKALSAGKDYNKENMEYTYVNAVNLENGESRNAGERVDPEDIIPAETEIKVTVYAKEGSYYTGSISTIYRMVKMDLKKAKVTVTTQTYTGKQIKPGKDEIKVEIGKNALSENDYDIISYGENIKKGTGTLTIKGKGNYGGIKTASFKIKAKGFLWWRSQ